MNQARLRGDDGATMVEYALLVALIAVVCLASIGLLGNAAKGKFTTIGSNIGAVQ
jgi:pilus assembly protein Flp/PilA